MGDVADEIGLLPGDRQMAVQVRHDQPTANANRQNQRANEQAQRPFDRICRPGQSVRIQQINRGFPMRQFFTYFRRHERPFPIRFESGD